MYIIGLFRLYTTWGVGDTIDSPHSLSMFIEDKYEE